LRLQCRGLSSWMALLRCSNERCLETAATRMWTQATSTDGLSLGSIQVSSRPFGIVGAHVLLRGSPSCCCCHDIRCCRVPLGTTLCSLTLGVRLALPCALLCTAF
jgi:hypothetical protein